MSPSGLMSGTVRVLQQKLARQALQPQHRQSRETRRTEQHPSVSLSAVLQCFLLTFSDQPMSDVREVTKFCTALFSSKRAFSSQTSRPKGTSRL